MKLTYARLQKAHQIFQHVRAHYGRSRFYRKEPRLFVYHDHSDMHNLGFFDLEEGPVIGINFAACTTVPHFISSLLHEYKHYLQDPRSTYKGSYWTDPAELEANKEARRFTKLFR